MALVRSDPPDALIHAMTPPGFDSRFGAFRMQLNSVARGRRRPGNAGRVDHYVHGQAARAASAAP